VAAKTRAGRDLQRRGAAASGRRTPDRQDPGRRRGADSRGVRPSVTWLVCL